MKRYIVVIILVGLLLGIWQAQAQRNLNVLLQALGQSPTPVWRPIIRVPAIVGDLKTGQLSLLYGERLRLMSDIAYATSEPDTRYFHVLDPSETTGSKSITKAEFLTEANAALVAIEAQIAKLET